MSAVTAAADLAADAIVGLTVLAVGAVALLAMRHTMRSCECCSAPVEDEADLDDEVGDDPDRWRDYDVADELGAW